MPRRHPALGEPVMRGCRRQTGAVSLNIPCFLGCVGAELVLTVTVDLDLGVPDAQHLQEAGLLSCYLCATGLVCKQGDLGAAPGWGSPTGHVRVTQPLRVPRSCLQMLAEIPSPEGGREHRHCPCWPRPVPGASRSLSATPVLLECISYPTWSRFPFPKTGWLCPEFRTRRSTSPCEHDSCPWA